MFDLIRALLTLLPLLTLGMVRIPKASPPPSPSAPSACPPWCTEDHAHPSDAEHGTFREIELTLSGNDAEGGRYYAAGLHQEPDGEPYVSVAAEGGGEHWLTLEQAERHALDLLALVEAARGTTVERIERLGWWNRMGWEGARHALSYIADHAPALYRRAAEHGAREAGR